MAMEAIKLWTKAIRPKTLIASMSPVFIGVTLSLSNGTLDFWAFFFTLTCAIGIQVGTNLANDYFDFVKGADTEGRKGPLRVTQAGLVSSAAIKKATLFAFLLSALCGMYLIWIGGYGIAFLLALSIFLGVIYTGGPFPLGYLGLGDLFVFIFFGPIAVAGTYYLQTHTVSLEAFIAGIAPGALSTVVLIINHLRDEEEDRAASKKTLVVRFGKSFGKLELVCMLLTAFCIPLLHYESHPFTLLTLLLIFPALSLVRSVLKVSDPYAYNALFPKTAQLLFYYTILFCFGWML